MEEFPENESGTRVVKVHSKNTKSQKQPMMSEKQQISMKPNAEEERL